VATDSCFLKNSLSTLRARFAVKNFFRSAQARILHTKKRGKLLKLAGNMPDPDGAVMRRAVRIPIGYEISRAD
jgi:hypothetical protein